MKIQISGSPAELAEKAEELVLSIAKRLNVDISTLKQDDLCKSSAREPLHATLRDLHRESEDKHAGMMQLMLKEIIDVIEEE